MARRTDLIKGKTNYVLRNRHTETKSGTIYEEDYLTIRPDDGLFSDDYYANPHSNFKYRTRISQNEKKRHVRGQWIKPSNSNSNVWTLNDISSAKTSESQIELRPNYKSLKDFACYGSAVQMVKAAVTDIILRFPGGLSFYEKSQTPKTVVDGVTYYRISNEFLLDIDSEVNNAAVERPMKYLSASYTEYVNGTGGTIDKPSVTRYDGNCNNTIIAVVSIANTNIYVYLHDGEKVLLVKDAEYGAKGQVIIKPKDSYVTEFFSNLDDFEKVLLDRTSVPVYKATFEEPYETEEGYFYRNRTYIWPNIGDNFTPDISTAAYSSYIQGLVDLASYYDEHDSDNIWRMLTHESIKNLDWTFMRGNDEDNMDDVTIDSSKIRAVLNIYGRQYDDIKRYADNIKSSNSITYDRINNTPDYFLSDNVEEDGWESVNVGPSNDNSLRTQIIYSGSTSCGSTSYDANIDFFRTLSLNSDYIQSLKGTRRGIETVLGMFGLKNNEDYEIKEYVAIASGSNESIAFPTVSDMIGLMPNPYFDDEDTSVDDFLNGYPVIRVTPAAGGTDYLIPWFECGTMMENNMYFQGNGGWERKISKDIDLQIAPNVSSITETSNVQLYNETEPYMKFAATVDDIFELTDVSVNTICYVEDLAKLFDSYAFKDSTEESLKDYFSHYFVLENKVLSQFLGFVSNNIYNCYGWRNILTTEYTDPDNLTDDGIRVLNLESTKSIRTGNNPHIGKGTYDDGENYLSYYRILYKDAIEGGEMSLIDVTTEAGLRQYNKLSQFGFNVKMVRDDKKCAAFEDTLESSSLLSIGSNQETWAQKTGYTALVNPENGAKYDEAAANSVINVKNIEIDFKTVNKGGEYFKKYVNDVIIKYVEQMMPSTAVFRYGFDDGFNAVLISAGNATSIYDNGGLTAITADGASNDDDGDTFFIEDTSNALD